MFYTKDPNHYILRLEVDEEFQGALERFAKEVGCLSAFFSGFGALGDVELGFFDLEKQTYESTKHPGNFELLNATGNITLMDGKPFIHTHVTIAKKEMPVIGGHLIKGSVWITSEIIVTPLQEPLTRVQDQKIKNFRPMSTEKKIRLS